jgi:hypothetical protein
MDGWDVALLTVAGYVAVSTLVRLMNARRAELVNRFRADMARERARRQQEERRAKRKSDPKAKAA